MLLARPTVIDPIARYWPRIAILAYHPNGAFDAPLGWSPSEYWYDVWCGKPRMLWLSSGEKVSR